SRRRHTRFDCDWSSDVCSSDLMTSSPGSSVAIMALNSTCLAQDEITVSAGAKQVLFNAMMATLDPGDEIIIPTPFWVTYADIVEIGRASCRERVQIVVCARSSR